MDGWVDLDFPRDWNKNSLVELQVTITTSFSFESNESIHVRVKLSHHQNLSQKETSIFRFYL